MPPINPALMSDARTLAAYLIFFGSYVVFALGTVALVYLYPLRLTPLKLVGTDLAHAIPLALLAGLGHLWLGNVDYALLANLMLGSVPGVIIGSLIGHRLPAVALQRGIALVLGAVAIKLLLAR